MLYGKIVDIETMKELLVISGWTSVPAHADYLVIEGVAWKVLRTEWAPRMVDAGVGYSDSARVTVVVKKAE